MPPQTLRDARREGRLREELSDQAKESRGRLRGLWRKYGAVGIGVYFSIYFGSIAFFYGVYDYGVMTTLPSGGAAVIERVSSRDSARSGFAPCTRGGFGWKNDVCAVLALVMARVGKLIARSRLLSWLFSVGLFVWGVRVSAMVFGWTFCF